MTSPYSRPDVDNAWCPGCGNFGILNLLKKTMEQLELDKRQIVFVSGIGQAAKTPHYLDVHMFDGLHGRALPVATGIKAANPNLTVVCEGGDGDMYGEGGNHFLNAIRRNVNIVHVVHNNMVYGLTKGQASPTSQRHFHTKVQVDGVHNEPFNPLSTALAVGASFVSRIYVGEFQHALEVLIAAFQHPGYALVDIFQPCVTFNKVNTYSWFKNQTVLLDQDHDTGNRMAAMQKAMENDPYPLGILYQQSCGTFESMLWERQDSHQPLYVHSHDKKAIQRFYEASFL